MAHYLSLISDEENESGLCRNIIGYHESKMSNFQKTQS